MLTVPLTYVKGWEPGIVFATLVKRMVIMCWVTAGSSLLTLLDSVPASVGSVADDCAVSEVLEGDDPMPFMVVAASVDHCGTLAMLPGFVVVAAFASIADGKDESVLLDFESVVSVGFVFEVDVGPVSSLEVDVTVRYATVCTAEAAQTANRVVQY